MLKNDYSTPEIKSTTKGQSGLICVYKALKTIDLFFIW